MTKANKRKLIELAFKYALKSKDPHLKVGAVLIEKDNQKFSGKYMNGFSICASGYNCLPKSHKKKGYKDAFDKTRPEVIHAEAHALEYMFKNNTKDKKFELICTISPCLDCAKMILQSGIKKIYFKDYYKDTSPVNFLQSNGVKCERI